MAVPASDTASSTPTPPVQLYHQSSQYRFVSHFSSSLRLTAYDPDLCRNWRYSKQGLDKLRRELNEQAVERMKTLWQEERVSSISSSSVPAVILTRSELDNTSDDFYLYSIRSILLESPFRSPYSPSRFNLRNRLPDPGRRTTLGDLLPDSNSSDVWCIRVPRDGSSY